jgi:hypothetical protein
MVTTQPYRFWAILFAVGLELAMLFTPYPTFFHIPLTSKFVVVTLAAHLVFGIGPINAVSSNDEPVEVVKSARSTVTQITRRICFEDYLLASRNVLKEARHCCPERPT